MKIMSYRDNAALPEPKAKAFGPFIECYSDNHEILIRAEDIYKVKFVDDNPHVKDGLYIYYKPGGNSLRIHTSYEEFKSILIQALSWIP